MNFCANCAGSHGGPVQPNGWPACDKAKSFCRNCKQSWHLTKFCDEFHQRREAHQIPNLEQLSASHPQQTPSYGQSCLPQQPAFVTYSGQTGLPQQPPFMTYNGQPPQQPGIMTYYAGQPGLPQQPAFMTYNGQPPQQPAFMTYSGQPPQQLAFMTHYGQTAGLQQQSGLPFTQTYPQAALPPFPSQAAHPADDSLSTGPRASNNGPRSPPTGPRQATRGSFIGHNAHRIDNNPRSGPMNTSRFIPSPYPISHRHGSSRNFGHQIRGRAPGQTSKGNTAQGSFRASGVQDNTAKGSSRASGQDPRRNTAEGSSLSFSDNQIEEISKALENEDLLPPGFRSLQELITFDKDQRKQLLLCSSSQVFSQWSPEQQLDLEMTIRCYEMGSVRPLPARSLHVSKKPKIHQCDECLKNFLYGSSLRNHKTAVHKVVKVSSSTSQATVTPASASMANLSTAAQTPTSPVQAQPIPIATQTTPVVPQASVQISTHFNCSCGSGFTKEEDYTYHIKNLCPKWAGSQAGAQEDKHGETARLAAEERQLAEERRVAEERRLAAVAEERRLLADERRFGFAAEERLTAQRMRDEKDVEELRLQNLKEIELGNKKLELQFATKKLEIETNKCMMNTNTNTSPDQPPSPINISMTDNSIHNSLHQQNPMAQFQPRVSPAFTGVFTLPAGNVLPGIRGRAGLLPLSTSLPMRSNQSMLAIESLSQETSMVHVQKEDCEVDMSENRLMLEAKEEDEDADLMQGVE